MTEIRVPGVTVMGEACELETLEVEPQDDGTIIVRIGSRRVRVAPEQWMHLVRPTLPAAPVWRPAEGDAVEVRPPHCADWAGTVAQVYDGLQCLVRVVDPRESHYKAGSAVAVITPWLSPLYPPEGLRDGLLPARVSQALVACFRMLEDDVAVLWEHAQLDQSRRHPLPRLEY